MCFVWIAQQTAIIFLYNTSRFVFITMMEHVYGLVWTDSCRLGYHSLYSDLLQSGWSRARIPVAIRFFTPIHTGSGAYPASYAVGTSSFSWVKLPGRSDNHPPPI